MDIIDITEPLIQEHQIIHSSPAHMEHSFFKKRLYLLSFRQRGREGEKHQCVVAFACPLLGTWPAAQACALTGNRTSDPLVCRPALNLLSSTSQGHIEHS